MRRPAFAQTLLLGLVAAGLSGCGSNEAARDGATGGGSSSTTPAESGAKEVVVDGSSTVFRISQAAQLRFKRVNRKVSVLVGNHGTSGGFGKYLEGEVDIVDASRAAKVDEESKAKARGLDWTRYLVGYDGITIVVNPKNGFVKALTVDQLKRLFASDSRVATWKDLDPSWPARRVVLYSPDNDSGTYEFFVEAILGKGNKPRKDVQQSPDDNTLVSGVAGDPDGLGYFGYAYFSANQEKLRAVPIQDREGTKPVEPNLKTILSKAYAPLARPLYIYVKNASMKRPEVAAFVEFYLENIRDLAKAAGYVPPNDEDMAGNAKALPCADGPAAGKAE